MLQLSPAIRRQLQAKLDVWLRLRRWVRWLCGTLVVLVIASIAFASLNSRPPAPLPTVSIKLAGPPPLPKQDTAIDPAQLQALLTAREELKPAQFEALQVATQDGMLPRKDASGLTPRQAYAYQTPMLPTGTKKLAVIVLEMGLTDRLTQSALALPAPVTLAYDATATGLADQINAARAAGHEVMLDIPMEPRTYPLDDPGPDTLLVSAPPRLLLEQLRALLARGPGAVALLSRSGDYFMTQSGALWPILQELGLRGLGWVSLGQKDSQNGETDLSMAVAEKQKLPAARATLVLDEQPGDSAVRSQFDAALTQLETSGQVLVIVHAYPATLTLLNMLLQTLPGRGIALVPASSLLQVRL